MKVLHYKNDNDQPYGSESRKCDVCGVMIWGNSLEKRGDYFVNNEGEFTQDFADKHGLTLCDGTLGE